MYMQAARPMFYPETAHASLNVAISNGYLFTAHGTIVCWDSNTSRVVHRSLGSLTETVVALQLLQSDPANSLYKLSAATNPDFCAYIGETSVFRAQTAKSSFGINLNAADKFLCAEVNSTEISLNRLQAREWETFQIFQPPKFS